MARAALEAAQVWPGRVHEAHEGLHWPPLAGRGEGGVRAAVQVRGQTALQRLVSACANACACACVAFIFLLLLLLSPGARVGGQRIGQAETQAVDSGQWLKSVEGAEAVLEVRLCARGEGGSPQRAEGGGHA